MGDASHSSAATAGITLFIASALEEINDTCWSVGHACYMSSDFCLLILPSVCEETLLQQDFCLEKAQMQWNVFICLSAQSNAAKAVAVLNLFAWLFRTFEKQGEK